MRTKYIAKSLLVNGDNQFLAVRRSADDTNRPSQWDLPGGGVDVHKGENFEEGAVREIQEEVGLSVTPDQLSLVYTSTIPKEDVNMIRLFYVARLIEVGPVVLSPEHDQYEWMSFETGIQKYDYERHRDLIGYVLTNQLIPEMPVNSARP